MPQDYKKLNEIGNWAEIYERGTKKLIKIVYNPYNKTKKEIIDFWIPIEYRKDCYIVFTNGRW